jgi:hypothetical protein
MGPAGSVAWERAMKLQEVILRAIAKRITCWQAQSEAGAATGGAASLSAMRGEVMWEELLRF